MIVRNPRWRGNDGRPTSASRLSEQHIDLQIDAVQRVKIARLEDRQLRQLGYLRQQRDEGRK